MPAGNARNQGGWQLVELLIAILVMSILATNIISSFSMSMRGATNLQNQVIASDICQEVIDGARNLTWSQLTDATHQGTHTLLVNRMSAGQSTDPAFPRPLLQDVVNLNYTNKAEANHFRADITEGGSVIQTISPPTADGTITVTVTVTWKENNQSSPRTYSQETQITRNGIHN